MERLNQSTLSNCSNLTKYHRLYLKLAKIGVSLPLEMW